MSTLWIKCLFINVTTYYICMTDHILFYQFYPFVYFLSAGSGFVVV